MFLSIFEIIDAIIISLALGYIFMDSFQRFAPRKHDDIYSHYSRKFDWNAFKFAAIVTAPAIILHEFGHKFVAMAYGLSATFQAASFIVPYGGVLFGVLLKLIGSPIIFFVPAWVTLPQTAPLTSAIIAFAGPAVNGLLWLGSHMAIKKDMVKKKHLPYVYIFRYINGFLFIFNMIPIVPFDGGHVVEGLIKTFFS
jgi:Zn-dependent protease